MQKIQIYLCSTCNTQVTINNAVGWCDICENAESQSECKPKTDGKIEYWMKVIK